MQMANLYRVTKQVVPVINGHSVSISLASSLTDAKRVIFSDDFVPKEYTYDVEHAIIHRMVNSQGVESLIALDDELLEVIDCQKTRVAEEISETHRVRSQYEQKVKELDHALRVFGSMPFMQRLRFLFKGEY